MSTPAYLGILVDPTHVRYIYVHKGGYPSTMAPLLMLRYRSRHSVEQLIGLGDLSSLDIYPNPPGCVHHTFDHPAKNTTVAYHRDRGDAWEDVAPTTVTKTAFRTVGSGGFTYLFDEQNTWRILKGNGFCKLKQSETYE